MRDGRRVGQSGLLGVLLSTMLAAAFWATGSDATTSLVVGASSWPFLVLATYLALRDRGDQAAASRERAGIVTDEDWQSLRRTIAGREVAADPRVRREAIVQLRRTAVSVRYLAIMGGLWVVLATTQTALAYPSGPWLLACLSWLLPALCPFQIRLARTRGRRADALEATDGPPSAI